MMSLRNNKKIAVLGLAVAMVVGCTATGGISLAKIAGTIMQAAALNYTGAFVTGVDALVTAFTGQPVQRPNVQQYPQDAQYPGQQYPGTQYPSQQYPSAQYPGYQYPDSQDPGYQYPQSQYPDYQYPETQYPDQQYPSQQYPDQQYPSQQYPDQQYPDQQYPSQQYPDTSGAGAGYPQQSWEPWGDPYPNPSTRVIPDDNALSIDMALFTALDGELMLMPDGARLRDGVGRSTPGDRFGIVFTTKEPAYVYIVNIDATGWAQTLFPYPDVAGFDNPVSPGAEVLLPNDALYGLDDTRGVETIFVLVSRTPNIDLEQTLAPLRGMERSAMVGTRGTEARVSVPMVGQRGLKGIVPGASQSQDISLDRFFTERSTNELAFSRWFVHE